MNIKDYMMRVVDYIKNYGVTLAGYFRAGLVLTRRRLWITALNSTLFFLVAALFAFTFIGIFAMPGVYAGYTKFLIRATRGENTGFGSSFRAGFQNGLWWKMLLLMLIYYVLAGLAISGLFLMHPNKIFLQLLLLPTIYVMIICCFASTLIVDKGFMPIKALVESYRAAHRIGIMTIAGLFICVCFIVEIWDLIEAQTMMPFGIDGVTSLGQINASIEMATTGVAIAFFVIFLLFLLVYFAFFIFTKMLFMTVYENAIGNSSPNQAT